MNYFNPNGLFRNCLNKNVMETTINQRVNDVLKSKQITVNALAKMISMPQTTLNNYVLGNRKISFELIEKIATAFPELNKEWLLTGKGEMLNEPNLTPATLPDNESAEEYFVTANGTRYLKRDDGQLLMEVNVVPIAALAHPMTSSPLSMQTTPTRNCLSR